MPIHAAFSANDNDGLSPDSARQPISKVNSHPLLPGDAILFKFNNNIVYGTVSDDALLSRCIYIGDGNTQVASMNNNLCFQDDAESCSRRRY